jgi:predicted Zn-dependent peptidase
METNQAHLTLAFKNYSMKDMSRHSASILSVILGGGMTSRLFEQVREKRGLAYSVSSMAHFYSDCGVFYIDAGVAPENTEETFEVIIQELNSLKNNLNIHEVSSSKELIKGRMMMRYEDSRSVAMNYGTQELLNGKITSIDDSLKSLEKVEYDEILEAFDYIFNNDTMIVSAAGSIEKIPDLTKNKDFF